MFIISLFTLASAIVSLLRAEQKQKPLGWHYALVALLSACALTIFYFDVTPETYKLNVPAAVLLALMPITATHMYIKAKRAGAALWKPATYISMMALCSLVILYFELS